MIISHSVQSQRLKSQSPARRRFFSVIIVHSLQAKGVVCFRVLVRAVIELYLTAIPVDVDTLSVQLLQSTVVLHLIPLVLSNPK